MHKGTNTTTVGFMDRGRRLAVALMLALAAAGLTLALPALAATTGPDNPPAQASAARVVVSRVSPVATFSVPARLVPAPVTASATGTDVARRTGKWIEIILSSQRLIAWQNGRAVMSSAISSGVRRYPTRRGTFAIRRKYRATRMTGPGYNLPRVPWTMYYSGSYAIHGAYWHNNFGRPMSHGCVNLPVGFAARLYAWAPVGTTVVIH